MGSAAGTSVYQAEHFSIGGGWSIRVGARYGYEHCCIRLSRKDHSRLIRYFEAQPPFLQHN